MVTNPSSRLASFSVIDFVRGASEKVSEQSSKLTEAKPLRLIRRTRGATVDQQKKECFRMRLCLKLRGYGVIKWIY